jgi:hypothetical protein
MKFLITTENLKQYNVEIVEDKGETFFKFYTLNNQYIASYYTSTLKEAFNLNPFGEYQAIDQLCIDYMHRQLRTFNEV